MALSLKRTGPLTLHWRYNLETSTKNKPLVVVPTYNESENIARLLTQLRDQYPDVSVLVVDDNSPDGTAGIVQRYSDRDPMIHLLLRERKEGLGKAYIAGFDWGLAHGFDQLVEMDADFSHDPKYLGELLEALDTHDVAMGSRYIDGGDTPGWGWSRRFISRGGNLYAKWMLQIPYEDLTGGFNAWTKHALETIDFKSVLSKGYAFQVELKCKAHRAELKMVEIPIQFPDRTHGESKFKSDIIWEAATRVYRLRRTEA